jgi:hypothetical protein
MSGAHERATDVRTVAEKDFGGQTQGSVEVSFARVPSLP